MYIYSSLHNLRNIKSDGIFVLHTDGTLNHLLSSSLSCTSAALACTEYSSFPLGLVSTWPSRLHRLIHLETVVVLAPVC